jgi:uncharacterized protein (DUF4415 family)
MKEKENTSTNSSVLDPEDDAPDLTTLDLSKGWFERGGECINDEEGRQAFGKALEEQQTITIDSDIAAYFQARAGREGIETAVNRFLRERINLEAMFRRVLREELRKETQEAS